MQSIVPASPRAFDWQLLPAFLLLPFTFCCFYFLPQWLGTTAGYVLSFMLYWSFCLIHGLLLKRGSIGPLYRLPAFRGLDLLLVLLCFLPAVGAFSAAFLVALPYLSAPVYLVLLGAALVNGSVEEFYWRGAFISRYGQHLTYAFVLPVLLFGLWHISVYAAYGVQYQGGFVALVGGAMFMGVLWGYTAYRQQRILVPTLAHILTNFFAFSNLLVQNFME